MRALVVLVIVAASVPAAADQQTDQLMARELFSAGERAFAAGDYRGAIAAFTSADRLAPSAIHALEIAVCHERLGNPAAAVRWYKAYLRRDPQALGYRKTLHRLAVLDSRPRPSRAPRCESAHPDLRDPLPPNGGLAEVTISSYPPRAAVFCHGKRLGQTPMRIEVSKSRNTRLVVARHGYREAVLHVNGHSAVEERVLYRIAANGSVVHPDLKDPSEDVL